jgi:tRNA U34 5-methylaminomethyl-2-thiouridine-forming methyltransferase MnmC
MVNRELRITEDGSHTIYLRDLDEPYHSIHGSIQESMHVFINQGFNLVGRSPIRILEIGLGTGLNILLTLAESEKRRVEVSYHAVEKYPLVPREFKSLNFEQFIPDVASGSLMAIHERPWGQDIMLSGNFTLFKELADIRDMIPNKTFDLVYFDAFAPDKQPELWNENVFRKVAGCMKPGAILVTYAAKGSVRRTMKACGFLVEKVPGPPGKREMIRARRI